MTVITESRITNVVTAAEALLSQRAGSAVVLADPEDLGGSGRTTVVRVRAAKNPLSMDRSLVIKALPGDEDPQAFHREIAAYKYATALPTESRPGPQLIASDPDVRLMVQSDLGHGRSMTDLLVGPDAVETSRAVSAWGQALGRMHAATFDGEHDFLALLRRGPSGTRKRGGLRDVARRAVGLLPGQLALLDLTAGERVRGLLEDACGLFDEGDHRAFSPADVGPENILINDEGVQFMDYEWGGFRDATLDIAYALVTFGPQLNVQAAAHRREMETSMVDAWRSEVTPIWPALSHGRESGRKLLSARTLWVWLATSWLLPLAEDGMEPVNDPTSNELASTDLSTERPVEGPVDDDAAADVGDGYGWALSTSDPRVVVARWYHLAEAAADLDEDVAAFATATGDALRRTWLD